MLYLEIYANYTVKGSGATSLQLESNDTLHLSDVLYVPGMKINLVFVITYTVVGLPYSIFQISIHFSTSSLTYEILR